jgi:hypothetical protein
MHAHLRPEPALAVAGIGDLAQERHHPQLLQHHGVERDLVQAVQDVGRAARDARALDRVDRNENRVLRFALADEWGQRRIARIAAVPIGLAVDLDRLEHRRQTGGGEQDVGRHGVVLEHFAASRANIGRRDKEMDRRFRQDLEIDHLGKDLAQGILAHGIDVVGRHQARHEIHRDIHGRRIERPAPEQHVERAALERAETGGVRDPPPERAKRVTRAGSPAQLMAVDQHRGVHCARRGAGDAVDRKPGLLQQAVEHAPGEGAVRPASLQGKIDQQRLARYRLGFGRHLVNLKHRGDWRQPPALRAKPKRRAPA